MLRKLFLDTNVINATDQSFFHLFGMRSELERLEKDFDILIPGVVFDEVIEHKKDLFEREKNKLANSKLASLVNIDTSPVEDLTFEELIETMKANEKIEYTICELSDTGRFFKKFYPLAIRHDPPFGKGSDKGFKDACISEVIEEYIDRNPDEECVFLITKDDRMFEYFNTAQDKVLVFKTADEAIRYVHSDNECPKNEIKLDMKDEHARGNISIIENKSKIDHLIHELKHSSSFASTHAYIAQLSKRANSLSGQDKIDLLKAAIKNSQILWLLRDEDVSDFFSPIFQEYQDVLSESEYEQYIDAAGLPYSRLDEYGNVRFSKSERGPFEAFVNDMINNIISRNWDSTIEIDADSLYAELNQLLAQSTLDQSLLSWNHVAKLFVKGGVETSPKRVSRERLHSFAMLLKDSNPRKRDAILQRIADRIEEDVELDGDLPF